MLFEDRPDPLEDVLGQCYKNHFLSNCWKEKKYV